MSTSVPSTNSSSHGGVFQNAFYIGINLQNILYGIQLGLYFETIATLWSVRRENKTSYVFYTVFSSIMLFLVTVWISTEAFFTEKMWILDSSYPSGPDQYWKDNSSVWYMDLGTTAAVLLQLVTDALMIYRCRIIWNSYRAIVIPIILWLASLVLGVLVDWTSSSPGGDFFAGISSQLGFAYYTVGVVLNSILTCMICYRIVRHGKEVQRCLGREYATLYFSVVMLIIESVLPYTVSGVAWLVTLGMGSKTSIVFCDLHIMMMCISPQMLILRVSLGRAWVDNTFRKPGSTFKFSLGSGTTRTFDTNGAQMHVQTSSNVYVSDGKV
ncbi:hypothetical protein JVU11DRAFT_8540 [Chiua virens]|nr:hypothetical protein JVU11DRAFT_8540 [Chiua virens]